MKYLSQFARRDQKLSKDFHPTFELYWELYQTFTKQRHSNCIHIVLRLSTISLIGCIGVPAKKIWGNEVLPKFCDVCPNHNFLPHYGQNKKVRRLTVKHMIIG